MSGSVTDVVEARRRRLAPGGRALVGLRELGGGFSPYGPEPPSEELLKEMLALPPSERRELSEILGAMALKARRRLW